MIPHGEYCYTIESISKKGKVYINTCQYWKLNKDTDRAVCYLLKVTDDYLLDDKCKICDKERD